MLYVLTVIHNRTCGDSTACISLQAQKDREFRVLIFDNSDTDFGIRTECEANGWTYLGGKGNCGLPAAYNAALDYLKTEKAEGCICILDDDTSLDGDFTADVNSAVKDTVSEILLPVLSQNGIILSPWRERGKSYFASYEECAGERSENLLAFNSGMVISLDIFNDYRYDERLFLDCVDVAFLTEMKRRGRKIAVVPIYCEQGFSGMEKPPEDAAMKRFAIYMADMRTYYGKDSFKCTYTLLKRAVHLALIYGCARPFYILSAKNTKKQEVR